MKIDNYKDRIIDKLVNDEDYGYDRQQAENFYNSNFSSLPDEILPNIEEWLEDRPFTEIDYYGLSIKKLQERDEVVNRRFEGAGTRYDEYFEILNEYSKNNHPVDKVHNYIEEIDIVRVL